MFSTATKTALALATAVLPLVSVGVAQAQARNLNFRFHNNTAYPVYNLYVSAFNRGVWGNDILGRDFLPSGYYTSIYVPDRSGTCYFDVRAVFPDGSSIEKHNFNLCQLTDISLP